MKGIIKVLAMVISFVLAIELAGTLVELYHAVTTAYAVTAAVGHAQVIIPDGLAVQAMVQAVKLAIVGAITVVLWKDKAPDIIEVEAL